MKECQNIFHQKISISIIFNIDTVDKMISEENRKYYFYLYKKNDVIQIEGPSFSESKHVITAKDCMCEDKFEQLHERRKKIFYMNELICSDCLNQVISAFRDVFFRYSFTVMGF